MAGNTYFDAINSRGLLREFSRVPWASASARVLLEQLGAQRGWESAPVSSAVPIQADERKSLGTSVVLFGAGYNERAIFFHEDVHFLQYPSARHIGRMALAEASGFTRSI